MQYMEGKVSSIKKLTGGVVFTDSIPRTPVGIALIPTAGLDADHRLVRENSAKASAG
jgi:hypothetical protein